MTLTLMVVESDNERVRRKHAVIILMQAVEVKHQQMSTCEDRVAWVSWRRAVFCR